MSADQNAWRSLLQHFAVVIFCDDAAQGFEIFSRAEHHDMREKLYRIGKRLLGFLEPDGAARRRAVRVLRAGFSWSARGVALRAYAAALA